MSTSSPLATQIAQRVNDLYATPFRGLEEIAQCIDEILHSATHDLCHDAHLARNGPVSPEAFCDGCEAFQHQLYGRSPITQLKARYSAMFNDFIRGMARMDDLAESMALALEDLLTEHGAGDVDPVAVAYDNMVCDAKVAAMEKALAAWRAFRPTRGLVGQEKEGAQ